MWFLIFAGVATVGAGVVFAVQTRGEPHRIGLQRFLERPRTVVVTKLEVYYQPWSMWTQPLTIAELCDQSWKYRVTIRFPSVRHVEEILRDLKLTRVQSDPGDYKLACVFHVDGQKPLTLAFANNTPVVSINGEPFESSHRLLMSVLNFIPKGAHDELFEQFVGDWMNMTRHWMDTIQQGQATQKTTGEKRNEDD